MKPVNKRTRRVNRPPAIRFPGGHIQIVNPRHPIAGVWSDILYLEPGGELPAHIHDATSSLVICVGGRGEIGINGTRTRLRKGVCAFILKGSEHYVKAARNSSLTCLSINEGIIKPGVGTDIRFTQRHDASVWAKFVEECPKVAAAFQKELKRGKTRWNAFTLDL